MRGLLCLALAIACDPAPVPSDSPSSFAAPVPSDRASALAPVPSDRASTLAPVPSDTSALADAPVPSASPPAPANAPVPSDTPRPPPPGFVDLRLTLPDACFTPGYAAADNFTGAPLPGYAAAGAWLLTAPATALAQVQRSLAPDGLTLLIFDAYRPRRASEAMVAWAHRSDRAHLVRDGYIARRSGHNHGHTIDLGLAHLGTCEPLDMGTSWDTLDERSHTLHATGTARTNRLRLLRAMQTAGFHGYAKEWWHFSHPLADTRPHDVPYGRNEPFTPDHRSHLPPKTGTPPPVLP